jgi:hypothetical protein
MRVTPQIVESLVNDRELRQQFRRLRRPPRKPNRGSCNGCGGNTPGPINVNELKRWMAEVLTDEKRDIIKRKLGTDTLRIRYRNKRQKVQIVDL